MKREKLVILPKLNDCNRDLSKQWFVYYSVHNPQTGEIEVESALILLKKFYTECRWELRKLARVNMSVVIDNEVCNLHYICDGFTLDFTVKEGGLPYEHN